MSSGVGIITTGEITVVGRNDCKDVIIGEYEEATNILELGSPFLTSCLSHWPMQGPQALANTMPPAFSKAEIKPSRSIVARTCSEPGVIVNLLFNSAPCSAACLTMEAERDKSS